jgi:single-stranded-DNA-specific exonuclease
LETASDRVIRSIQNQERILVWGDFDVDGQTSTALLISALNDLGAQTFHYIPVRSLESHGVSPAVLTQKIEDHSPNLIITCDTGIDAFEAVEVANKYGIDVIITDHHQLPPTLPKAHSIINPNTLPDDHPLFNLPGVGVAYKLIEQVYSHYSRSPSMLLDLVALGIVADVATQTKDTRFLLQKGLDQLRSTTRPGILEICKINNLDPAQITTEHIGFVIGPRLNALGRLDDANSSVEFLTTVDSQRASVLAHRLEDLNKKRQKLTDDIFQESENMIAAYPELAEDYPVLVLQGSQQWNPGVIGIVASRLVDRYHKPVIMLSQDGENARGSARSIPGVPISKLIGTTKNLLNSYGGHPMAAGLSLPLTNITQFRRAIARSYQTLISEEPPTRDILIDSEISFGEIDEELIRDVNRLAPFGSGNPKLLFSTRGVHAQDSDIRTIGRSGNHRKITFTDGNGDTSDFLWWNSADITMPDMPLDIAYSLEISSYRNQPQIQATLLHLRQSPEAPVYLPDRPSVRIVDLRNSPNPFDEISGMSLPDDTLVWVESHDLENISSVPRSGLGRCDTLIIWTTPPSKLVLSEVIQYTSPKQIIVVAENPSSDSLESFLQGLLGLIKHLKRTGKPFDLARFAEILAVPEIVIEVGIDWLHNQGDLDLSQIGEGKVYDGEGKKYPDFDLIDHKLKHLLREVLAYRSYFKNAHIRAIL